MEDVSENAAPQIADGAKTKKIKDKAYKILIGVFLFIIIAPSVIYPTLNGSADIELQENRKLADFGAGFNDFGKNFDTWYNDRVPFRSGLIYVYKSIARLLSGIAGGIVSSLPGDEPIVIENNVIYGRDGWLFFAGDNSEAYYTGENIRSESEMRDITSGLIDADEYLRSLGKRFAVQVYPNREQIYPEYMPAAYKVQTEYKRLDRLRDYVGRNSGVPFTYPKEELLAAKTYGYVPHYKFDTHHNNFGAFVSYQQLLKSLNMPAADYRDAGVTERVIYGGGLNSMIVANEKDKEYDVDYKPDITVTSEEVEEREIHSIVNYTSDCPGGKTVLYIGDSFRKAVLPYMCKDFGRVINLHWSRFGEPESADIIAECIADADIIVLSMVERYDETLNHIPGRLRLPS